MARTFFRKRDVEAAAGHGVEKEAARDVEAERHAKEKNSGSPVATGQGTSGEGHPDAASPDSAGRSHLQTDRGTTSRSGDGVERHAAIYDDTDVCRALGLLRRTVVRARQKGRRGVDWDLVDGHAGMTLGWIRRWNAHADLGGVKQIEPGDGIVTVRVTGRVMNGDVVQARRVADGTCVTVRGIRNAWYLHVGDEIDCRMQGGMLTFAPELNRERY